jgi:hypothetical protein
MKIRVQYTVELRKDQLATLDYLCGGEKVTQKDIKRYLRDLGVGGLEELTTRFCWRKSDELKE